MLTFVNYCETVNKKCKNRDCCTLQGTEGVGSFYNFITHPCSVPSLSDDGAMTWRLTTRIFLHRYNPFDDYDDKKFLTVDECCHEVTGAGKTIKIATKFTLVLYCVKWRARWRLRAARQRQSHDSLPIVRQRSRIVHCTEVSPLPRTQKTPSVRLRCACQWVNSSANGLFRGPKYSLIN